MTSHMEGNCCHSGHPKTPPSKFNKEILLGLAVLCLFLGSFIFSSFKSVWQHFYGIASQVWLAILAGYLIGGLIDRYIPKAYVMTLLARHKYRSVFYAVLLGFTSSVCSHGVLALAIELKRKGAPTSVVIAFLLASPWASLPMTILMLGFFGLKALWIVGFALWIACLSGLLFVVYENRGWVEPNPDRPNTAQRVGIFQDIVARVRRKKWTTAVLKSDAVSIGRGGIGLAQMTLFWVVLGFLFSSLLAVFVPSDFFHRWMSASFLGVMGTLIFAAGLEVCSEGNAPVAFEIYRQTGAFGNAFIFLMAGVVTDWTEIGALFSNIGKRSTILFLVTTLPQVVLFGIIANAWIK